VLAHVARTKGEAAPQAGDDDTVVPMNRIRKLTAERTARSVAVSPHVLQAVEVDFSAVEAARTAKGPAWRSSEGFSLTYLPFVARAVCEAIGAFPHVNASVRGDSLVVHRRVNLGVAVDLGFEGLVVPVVRDAQGKALRQLARELHALAEKARRRALSPDDVAGGTYTLSNSGPFGTLLTAPILQQPQVAILSTDGVKKRPVAVEGPDGDAVAVHPVGVLAQCFDHRAFDGAYSAAFLRRLREILEGRDWTAELT
jgi:pyruvate dehydrogenase E2 component (dihydrolipoamide acetyltransferase)